MGKYIMNPKLTCDVGLIELFSPFGVRTRAKTLAMKKLKSQKNTDTSSSYLQLRSRKLEKLQKKNLSPRKRSISRPKEDDSGSVRFDLEDGAWIGENNLEFERSERSTRESTPCSFTRESVTAGTLDSTSRQTSSTATNRRTQISNSITQEIEEFFASAEKQQQRLFAERYNYDVVNDVPLLGRYEWVRVEN